jgi:ABC-type multidrug transport system ATPase subunit
MNLPRLKYSEELVSSFALISELIKMNNKTLVQSTQDTILAQAVSSHIMYIEKGMNIYSDTLKKLIDKYDNVFCSIGINNSDYVKQVFELELPCYSYRVSQNIIEILVYNDYLNAYGRIFSVLSKYNFNPYFIKKNKKNLPNALKELVLYSDLQ